jgi:hypothetical protein
MKDFHPTQSTDWVGEILLFVLTMSTVMLITCFKTHMKAVVKELRNAQ